jgi:VCBS repeat-containing protein
VLDAIGNQSVAELATLSLTASATDADLPADTLTYTLDAASIALGMSIDATTGVFSWTPTESQGGLIPSVTITVTDSGSGTLTDSETFIITVIENILVISGIDTGIITENVSQTSGTLTLSYNQPTINPSLNGANFIAETIVGTHGSLTIDAFGHWNYIINDLATTQQLGVGERIFDTFTVSTNDGILHDVIITLNGSEDVYVSSPFPSDSDKTSLFGFYTSDLENVSNINTDLNSVLDPTASLASSLHKIPSIVPNESTLLPINFSENKFHFELEKSLKKTESVIQDEIVQQKMAHKPKQIQILLDQLSNKSIFDFNIDTENDFDTEEEQALWDRIDKIRHQMDDSITSSEDNIDVQIVLGTSISLTAGFVSWFLRGGALLTSLMSTMPFMNRFDPLPILKSRRSKKQPIFDNHDKNKKPSDDNRKLRKFFNRKKSL